MEKEIGEGWEVVDYYPCLEVDDDDDDDDDEGKLLGWGVSVGKKVAMAGLVISSLPLLLPPFLVISALGFAFSVPFGVVFASYTCTHKVMAKLLPLPPPHDALDYSNQTFSPVHDDNDDEPPMVGGTELVDNNGGDNVIRKGEEEQQSLEARDDSVSNGNVVETAAAAGSIGEEEEEKEKEDVKDGMEVRIELVDNDNVREEDVDEERGKEHHENEESDHAGKNVIDVEDTSVSNAAAGEDEAPPIAKDEGLVVEKAATKTGTESRGGKRKPLKSKKHMKKKEKGLDVHKEEEEEITTSSKEKSQEKNGGPVVEGKILQSCTVVVPDDTAGGGATYTESKITGADAELAENDEQIHHQNVKEAEDVHSDEGLIFGGDEKMIWEKIDAVRVIVGFKAPKRPSYYEELKALYLFTGIEPPASTASGDFPEFCNKLSFLMSVIGLK